MLCCFLNRMSISVHPRIRSRNGKKWEVDDAMQSSKMIGGGYEEKKRILERIVCKKQWCLIRSSNC